MVLITPRDDARLTQQRSCLDGLETLRREEKHTQSIQQYKTAQSEDIYFLRASLQSTRDGTFTPDTSAEYSGGEYRAMIEAVDTISTFGLSEVYSPTGTPEVDVVFVHGLNGHPYNTWTTHAAGNKSVDVFWPRDLLPKYLPTCRILTYGYDANVTSFTDPQGVSKSRIHNHAEDFAARLAANRSGFLERPLVFVCHSLGGLVTKQCLIYSRSISSSRLEHLRSVYVSTYGIVFLGTPHNGSDLAKWGSLLQHIASATLPRKYFDSSSHLVDALKTNNETLQNINVQFNEIIPRLHLYLFYEAKPMDMKGTKAFVVDMESAAPLFQGAERMAIEKDHSTMCKFEDERSAGYFDVARALQRYTGRAPELIAFRWREEKSVRWFQQENVVREMLIERAVSSRGTSPDTRLPTSKHTPLIQGSRLIELHEDGPQSARLNDLRLQIDDLNSDPTYEVEELEPTKPKPITNTSQHSTSAASSVPSLSDPPKKSISTTLPLVVAPPGFRPNSRFYGFDIEMARIVHKLLDEPADEIGVNSVLLHGAPGCGKSHLARQFVWQNTHRFPNGIFWIDCKTPESLAKCFWNIAQALDCMPLLERARDAHADDFVDSVREYLRLRGDWLIIFDGVSFKQDTDLSEFTRYIPDGKGSSIIYTTNDGTLENRNRLLEPTGIKIYPLQKEAACKLLYASMNLQGPPNSTQRSRAKQLVKYYDYLPLGIHAAAHMLQARGRPLEKYAPGLGVGSADDRLTTTYLNLLAAISRNGCSEAANLLMLMCFFSHEMPLAFLHFGNSSLAQFQIDIKSGMGTNISGGRRDLDNSILVLRKYGLIDRHLQIHGTHSSGGRSSPEVARRDRVTSRTDPETLSSDDRSHTESIASSIPTGVEVLRIHTVVQNVYLDHLRSTSEGSEALSWWLVVATRFLIAAWDYAQVRLSRSTISATADLREFQTHAEKLWSHYPKPLAATREVRQARHDLHEVRRGLRSAIEACHQSSNAADRRTFFASIFEKSGSSSDEGRPRTPSSAGSLTRTSTWGLDADQLDSPNYLQQEIPELLPKEAFVDSDNDDHGYVGDNEAIAMQRSGSNSTVTGDQQYQHGNPQAALRIRDANTSLSRQTPAAAAQTSRINTPFMHRPMSAGSLAEAALVAMQKQQRRPHGSTAATSSTRQPLDDLSNNSSLGANPSKSPSKTSPHTSPRLIQAVLSNNAVKRDIRDLPIEENVMISRAEQPIGVSTRSSKLSLQRVESGLSHSVPISELRGGFTMLRDRSRESDVSVQTDPIDFSDEEEIMGSLSPTANSTVPKHRTASDAVRPLRGLQLDAEQAGTQLTPTGLGIVSPVEDSVY